MHWVTEFCTRAMLIERGHVVAEGEPADIVAIHQEHSAAEQARRAAEMAAKLSAASAPVAATSFPDR